MRKIVSSLLGGGGVLLLWGCGEKETIAAGGNSEGSKMGVEILSEAGVIEGTGIASEGVDDPGKGGWRTEEWHGEMMAVQGVMKEALLAGDLEEVGSWECRATNLRPDRLEVLDGRVSRWKKEELEPGPFKEALREMTVVFAGGNPGHVKGKIVEIESIGEAERGAGTLVLMQLDGVAAEGGELQVNAKWSCLWDGSGGEWQLREVELVDYEEVRLERGGFVDVTGAVFEKGDELQKQFYRGQDHWMARVEMSHGIDVGGWQGVAIADVDGDGWEDLYVSQPGGLPNRLLKHLPDGRVKDISARAGVDWLEGTHGSLFADLDNDGDPDLIVGSGFGVIVMENDGAGNFETVATKLLTDGLPYSIAAADVDQDGDLDFYVCGYNPRAGVSRHHVFAHPVPYHDANNGGRNALFRNDGQWRFSDVTKQTGMGEHNTRFSYAATWEDYDQDGDLDLYVANDFGRNNLYRNELVPTGRVKFRDVAEEVGVEDVAPGMSAAWSDYNNDGWADLYVGNMFSSAGNRIVTKEKFQADADDETKGEFLRHAKGNSLFENLGGEKFADVGTEMRVNLGRWAWASKFADLDNDGWQDLVVANGFVTQEDTGDL